jgi:hypothetical protein
VLYAGLLSQAHEEGLAQVRTSILQVPTEESGRLAIIKAEVETSRGIPEGLRFGCPEKAIYLLRELREGESLSRDVSKAGRDWPWLLET